MLLKKACHFIDLQNPCPCSATELLLLAGDGSLVVLDASQEKMTVLVHSSVLVSIRCSVNKVFSILTQRQYHQLDQNTLSGDKRFLLLHHRAGGQGKPGPGRQGGEFTIIPLADGSVVR